MPPSGVLFSADAPYLAAALTELQQVLPESRLERFGAETGIIRSPRVDVAAVAALCRERPVVFVRHLLQVAQELPGAQTAADAAGVATAAEQLLGSRPADQSLSLQVWNDPAVRDALRPDKLRQFLVDRIQHHGISVSRGGADLVLGVCVTPTGTCLGLTQREDALADWPGGRVGLAHRPDQISRSALKLEELFKLYPMPLPPDGTALDLGASPGGWTQVLRRAGLEVWAVDPADLDPRVARDADVHHERTTTGQFLARTNRMFDVIVNDMRMTAPLSASLMLEAVDRLRPGGWAIMTVKLSPKAPLATVSSALQSLRRVYTIRFARQLFHNRNEVTVVAQRR